MTTTRRNAGLLSLPEIPSDQWIAGAIVLLANEEGEYTAHFHLEAAEHLPHEDVRESLGEIVAQAWSMSNIPTTDAD